LTLSVEGGNEDGTSITLGDGSDTVIVQGTFNNVLDATAGGFREGIITIADFNANTAGDVLDFNLGAITQEALIATEVSEIADADSLFDALELAASYVDVGNDLVAFDYGGNAYILRTGDNTFSNGDGLIELTGVSVADLDASNFLL